MVDVGPAIGRLRRTWSWLGQRKLERYVFVAVLISGVVFSSDLFDSRELEADGLEALARVAGTTGLILAFRIVIFLGLAYLVAAVVFLVRSGRWPSEVSTKSVRFAERAGDGLEEARDELLRLSGEKERLIQLLKEAGDRIRELEDSTDASN